MMTSRTLHVFGVAALSLALVGSGGSVHARRGPSEPLSSAAIDQVTCSEATPRRMTRAATFKAEVLLDRLDNGRCNTYSPRACCRFIFVSERHAVHFTT
jgi:hypothetical protein